MNNTKPYNIFLAEDDPDDVFLFQEALNQLDEEVNLHVAIDGGDLMKKLEEFGSTAHLVVLDINMPIKNGIECLDAIRAADSNTDLPVVILSTSTDEKLIDQTYDLGANLYVEKPPTFSSLKEIIRRFVLEPSALKPPPLRENFLIASK